MNSAVERLQARAEAPCPCCYDIEPGVMVDRNVSNPPAAAIGRTCGLCFHLRERMRADRLRVAVNIGSMERCV